MFDGCPLKRVNVGKCVVLGYDFPEPYVIMEIESSEKEQY
jgi:hypothetical protein